MMKNSEFVEEYLGWNIYLEPKSNGEFQIVALNGKEECRGASCKGKLILKLIEIPHCKMQIKENTDELIVLMWEKTNGNERKNN